MIYGQSRADLNELYNNSLKLWKLFFWNILIAVHSVYYGIIPCT